MYTSNPSLPRGVVRGCPRCDGCQKVLARWLPERGHRPTLETAPAFYPNEEEFKDTLKYIANIRPVAEPYGICRIVPPPSWKPPCPLRDKVKWQEKQFHTRVQQIHKLQVRQATATNVDGGRHKRRRLSRMTGDLRQEELDVTNNGAECLASNEDGFGFDTGPEFTLEAFQTYATEFKDQYFRSQEEDSSSDCIVLEGSKGRFAPSVENIEGEYWRVVEKPTEQIEVLYGTDVETRSFGNGFPKEQLGAPKELADSYLTSGWNLNNIARLPGSMLSFEEDIPGVVVPWVYVGMCFSSFCWHVEDHHLYSLNYLHWGAPKVWYGVPGYAAVKLENAMRKKLPHLFEEQPDLLQKLVTQLSPSTLKCEGVPVYRCVQQAGEFIVTFPRAYHAGFNCGFNCAEAVNVAPADWLPHGQIATELYQELSRKTSLSHDKILLGASREAVKILWEFSTFGKYTSASASWDGLCGKDGLLTKALKVRVEMESVRRASLPNFAIIRKMDRHFEMKERECVACCYDLHLSAVGCGCCPEIFACLEHVSELCSCDWSNKFLLYRYDVSELYILIQALRGKQGSINRWATQDLGLTLDSYVNLSLSGICEAAIDQDRSICRDLPRAKGYDVRVLDVGVVEPCKPWYDSETIFPRGFRSRVTFYSVLDPAQMCTYISEVLDTGLKQPVFQVTIAGHPTEVFMHISIQKCWELVVERLNKEITRQQSIGKKSIPHLPPPESLNGLEMFGFTSPSVVHAIETLDHGHQCTDYWAARSNTSHVECVGRGGAPVKHYKEVDFGIVKDSNVSPDKDLLSETDKKDELTRPGQAQDEPNLVSLSSSENVYVVLEKLFKRAQPNELWTLHKVLSGEASSPNWKSAFRALTGAKEIVNINIHFERHDTPSK